jgi:CheY-like chemotaxis protein
VVRLPSVTPPVPHASDPHAQVAGQPRRVLIVEDNADARESLSSLLALEGHEVLEAADGEAGLELALRLRPDAALVDIGLPVMDGYEFARRLRARGASLWLVALTGYGQPADRQRALEAGFDGHVVKPISADDLVRVLGGNTHRRPSPRATSRTTNL